MESAPSTCFLRRGLVGYGLKSAQVTVRLYSSSWQRWYPTSCKMRQRNFSLQNKRQQAKKINLPANTSIKPIDDNNTNTSNTRKGGISPTNSNFEPTDNSNLPEGNNSDSDQETDSSTNIPVIEYGYLEGEGCITSSQPDEVRSLHNDNVDSADGSVHFDENTSSYLPSNVIPSTTGNGGQQRSGIGLQDLIGMIRSAEKNIHLLNAARIRALEDLEKILSEKESLQGEINNLEMKLAETDARLKVAAQEKIRVELLEGQLEKLRIELSNREEHEQELNNVVSSSQFDIVSSFSQELDSLRAENTTLQDELQALKAELSCIRETDQRVQTLEEERSLLQSSFKELEFKLAASHEDVSTIPSLKSECKNLYEKVEDLQTLLDKATEQADQAFLALQQNQELRKKVDQLEDSVGETSDYKLSSEKMQHHNELMQQKIELLDDRLNNSNEEIHYYFKLCQDSINEFQETLNALKEESKKSAEDESVHDKPSEFWSNLLLLVDGWFLEKKISVDQVKMLREMIWNRERSICDSYMSMQGKSEREIISTFLKLTSSTTGERLHVIHIAAEMAPVAKVGGLGDVVTGLSKALQRKGHLVEVVLPKYDCMQYESIHDLKVLDVAVESYFDGRLFKNKIWVGTVEGLPVYFIEPLHPSKFFWRNQFYGEKDDFKRFSYFSRAALELILQAGKKPDIIHCHDWQTAFVAPLYWDLYVPKGLDSARICFTCHNFEYQGLAPASELASCGLDVHQLNRPDRMQDHSANDRVNPVKGAVVFSNIVTTVSPTYAQEVRSSEGGRGLQNIINTYSKKFVGILNGIDTDAWNPATDPFLKVQYHSNDIDGKAENKEALRRHLQLSSANDRQPLVACITRLVPQKGVHLIRHAIYQTLELGGQFVLLGSSPVPKIQREFEEICDHFKTHEHARLILKYDEALSHLIYAASDMLIIPSIFEPCGLTQMIAMRYGSIPIVRKTGGLNDSVFDFDDETIPPHFRNGFTFLTADEQDFNSALKRAFYHYMNDGDNWKQLVQKVMNLDFSWDSSAPLYEQLYRKSVARARARS
ncbi:probable starch synthase 4, chloroplastic/amyloplastic isoform X2 [Salvia miltiorrhiza]|uniref:probable starch synthase 4, chloroplastic/amyloplastic isoform X2 n=1 Tax=Salvia miltiorrhiza TaxID=226208 RepID=UPI0025AC3172|nr:probable starch synthase 4, chloroplastic/amyloplastic isoform X2 [Salvia miltiorrhiza]